MSDMEDLKSQQGIAVIGLAGRFPGAADVEAFWRNLRDGVESIRFFSEEELAAAGVPVERLRDPSYVRARGVLDGVEQFDSPFFEYSPREAEIIDPQHRLFLECAWEALENAGYAAGGYEGAIGVYAGASLNTYLLDNLVSQPDLRELVRSLPFVIAGASDYLTTRTSYKLDLRGPGVTIQTACSTSLVAVHMACQSLLDFQCDIALAGGASVRLPQISGYFWQKGGIASPDGHCRPFDIRAQGTVGGNGVGIVALKRLEDALGEGDTIHAVIRGTAVNNDGSSKVSYSAPSVDGQARVIALAQALAGVEPESIDYIEAHGTGTALGDPIEVAALTKVFRATTGRKGFCALGSVKSNIGHLDAASGIAGLIKTILSLRHRQIPPSLHFERPNPEIGLEESPFYINARLADWDVGDRPRRAGVSSFGIGGTNAHVVLEEAPAAEPSGPSRPWQLLVLSARSYPALEASTDRLANHLAEHPEQSLADVAHTLRVGRRGFPDRRILVCREGEDARAALAGRDPRRLLSSRTDAVDRPVAFLLSGLGDQYVGMGQGLYRHEPAFRREIDRCAEILTPWLRLDARDLLYPDRDREEENGTGLDLRALLGRKASVAPFARTDQVQPILFVLEYALARLWMSWGVHPQALLGYSLGEYVAACLAGVFSLEDALLLVSERARMIQELPAGAMLAVPLPEERACDLLGERLSLAAVNGPGLCVVAGPEEDVAELERMLPTDGLSCRRLQTTHAFHSRMMEPIAERLTDLVKRVRRNPPSIPYLSNVDGGWITAAEATDPGYWARHLCQPVRFGNALRELWREPSRVLLEVGPGQSLCSLALQLPAESDNVERVALPSLRNAHDRQPDQAFLLGALGRLWLSGVSPNWTAFAAGERRRRVPLPAYPFERQRYWIEPYRGADERASTWPLTTLPGGMAASETGGLWLVLTDDGDAGRRLAERLRSEGRRVMTALAGAEEGALADDTVGIDPRRPEGCDSLLSRLDNPPEHVVHLRTPDLEVSSSPLLLVVQALSRRWPQAPLRLTLISDGAQPILDEAPRPAAVGTAGERRGHARPNLRNLYVAPSAETERALAALWEDLLGLHPVGLHDNFFELGGHSLLGMQLLSRTRGLFGVQLSPADLFEAPTVDGLSTRIRDMRSTDRLSGEPPLVRVSRDRELPLSFAQQRLWFLDQLDPNSPAYNLPVRTRLRGPLDQETLRYSFREIVRRHETLRTRFATVDGRPRLVISPEPEPDLTVVDLSGREDREREVQRMAVEEVRRPFRLVQDLPLRVLLLRLAEEEHALILTIHHLVSDGWSNSLLLSEMAELYSASIEQREPQLPQLPVQYADFAYWQQQWIESEGFAAQLAYWRKRLSGAPSLLELPTDRPRPAQQTFHGASVRFAFPAGLAADLGAAARNEGATPFMALLAGFVVLLSRYSGQEEVLVGSPIANRTRLELEPLIGFFANTLVLRSDLTGAPSFVELLRRVRETALGAFAHQDMPFERLVEELQPERDLSHPPLFQVVFVLQNVPFQRLRMPGLALSPLGAENTIAKFDWTLSLIESESAIEGWLEYNTDLFDGSTVRRAVAHYENLLRSVVADPEIRVPDLPLLTRTELAQLLTEWSSVPGASAPQRLVHERIAEQAARRPEALSLISPEERVSYGELDWRASLLAGYLRGLGVGREVGVGIFLERSASAIVAILGVLKAGGTYVPLDPSYPRERLAWLVEDSGVSAVLTESRLAGQLPVSRARIVCLDTEREAIERADGADSRARGAELLPDNLAYQIYTSGSTGTPKGILVTHRGLANLAQAFIEAFDLEDDDRLLMVPSLSFDASVGDIFPALASGAALVLHPAPSDLSGRELQAFGEEHGVTIVDIPAALWQQWLDELIGGVPAPRALRMIIAGGESVDRERVRAWQRATGGRVAFFGPYGPTEATVCTTFFKVDGGAEVPAGFGRLPIGRPVPGARVYLLDRQLNPVPTGVPGEVCIGGVGLARGYLGRPDATAERFIPEAFGDAPGGRLYRTGDLARYLSDGNLEFLGRVDHQVKIRGYRIELGEVEAALARHPEVREVVVLAREDQPGQRRLVAYLTRQTERELESAELRAFLQQRLPVYMVPSAYVMLDAFPVSPNGKVDRRALPAPDGTRSEVCFVAPRTPAERTLAGLWAQVLRLDKVGIHDNFFDLGGDSILSIQIVARANGAGLRLAPRHLFQHQTVAELAEVASAAQTVSSAAEQAPPESDRPPGGVPFPLTSLDASELSALAAMLGDLDDS